MRGTRHVPVSVVCVSNDPRVLAVCLRRSLARLTDDPDETELVVVDNREGAFASAGAALNHGASVARHDVVAFAHQDVYLHSVDALERAAATLLSDGTIGLLGAVGITADDDVVGTVRDRVVLIGAPAPAPRDVDSVDEVLFLLRRSDVLDRPLTEDPDLAWHAYAVEYGAHELSTGRRVAAVDLAVTHNSMTVNLARLAEAHARVAALHPDQVPLRTTCGVVRGPDDRSRWRTVARRRRGLATWLAESRSAVRLARAAHVPTRDIALADVRLDIDDALDLVGADRLDVVALAPAPTSAWDVDGLERRGRGVRALCLTQDQLELHLATADARAEADVALLVTGLTEAALARLTTGAQGLGMLVGHAADTGTWALLHPRAERARLLWPGWRRRPFGLRRADLAVAGAGGAPEPSERPA